MSIARSLAKDRPDTTALHSPKWREELDAPAKALGEQVPFFYTRAGAVLPLEGMYRGGHAFLMANGPSVAALDLARLHRRWVMTLNNGARTFRGNANCTVDEPSRFSLSMWLDPTILKFAPMSHFEKPLWDNRLLHMESGWVQRWEASKLRLGDCPNVVGYRRNEKYHAPRWLNEETINWGNHGKHGGGRSVLLAALRILHVLGFRKVYLLGVDFDMSATKRYHFDEGRTVNAIKGNLSTYAKLQAWLTELQPLFLKAGYVVRNCNPESHLTAFPFIPYEEALAESGAQMGDVTQERTEGMYSRVADEKARAGKEGQKMEESREKEAMASEGTAEARSTEPGAGSKAEEGAAHEKHEGHETCKIETASPEALLMREKLKGEEASEAAVWEGWKEEGNLALLSEKEAPETTPLRTQLQ